MKTYTVLIVDDSETDRATYRYLLQKDRGISYRFVECDCGKAALNRCRTANPDIILLNYRLPDWHGLIVLHQLRQQIAGVCVASPQKECPLPVIMLVREQDDSVAAQALQHGTQDYLVKEKLTSDLLCRTVRHAIERMQLLEQTRQQQQQLQQLNAELEQRVEERTTELQQANDRLQQELFKQRLTQKILQEQAELLNLAHDGILTLDLIGVITFWNRGAELLYGWTENEALGEEAHILLQTQFPQLLVDIQAELLRRDYWEGELTHINRKGTPVTVASRWVLQRNQRGTPIGILEINNDITQRKAAELELQQAKVAAEAANQSKSMFLANMSHELRTPLNVILGFTQVMRRDASLSIDQQETVRTIHRCGEHLLNLINDILDISKIEAGRTPIENSSFDLLQLLQSLETMLLHRAQTKGLQFQVAIDAAVPQYIISDVNKLRQILLNLLGNAIKFTEQGSVTLRVSINQAATEPPSHEKILPSSLSLRFEVEDTGIGIAPDEIEEIFDAFVQSRSERTTTDGTGLGLTISRRFVELMHGTLLVHSTPGQGSIFWVDLPIERAEPIDVSPSESQRQIIGLVPDQPICRILVVDDQPENRQLLTKLMTQLGFEVQQATNGQEALTHWQTWQPHLIWMDIRMPVMNGYEATRQIRALEQGEGGERKRGGHGDTESGRHGDTEIRRYGDTEPQSQADCLIHPSTPPPLHPSTPIIALTAQASMTDRAAALSAGCTDYVIKPFNENDLYAKLEAYLNLHFLYTEPAPLTASASATPAPIPSAAALSVMSPDWITALSQAAQLCDEEDIEQLMQQIPETQGALTQYLRHLAHDYQFDQIKQFIQQNSDQPGEPRQQHSNNK